MAITPPPQNRAYPSPSTRLKPSTPPERRTGAVTLAVAGGMYQPQSREVIRAAVLLGTHGMHMKLLAVFESLVTNGATPLLPAGEVPRALRQGRGAAPSLSPVVLEGWVIGGIGLGDQPMAHAPCPGEFPAGGRALLILKDPAGPSGAPGLAPVRLGSPPARLARVASLHVPLSASVPAGIQVGADPRRPPLRKSCLQPRISGFMALISATGGAPTCCRQRALRFRRRCWREPWLGLISSLAPLREL